MTEKPRIGAVALRWWGANLDADRGAARALAARLRRASGAVEILAHREVFELGQALQIGDPKRLALIAQTLAFVTEHTPRRLAAMLGADGIMSELRFQRLLRSPDLVELGTGLRRALMMVDGRCNVAALGSDLFYWGEMVRTRWCFDYFGANPSEQPATTKSDAIAAEETSS